MVGQLRGCIEHDHFCLRMGTSRRHEVQVLSPALGRGPERLYDLWRPY